MTFERILIFNGCDRNYRIERIYTRYFFIDSLLHGKILPLDLNSNIVPEKQKNE